MPHYFFHHCDSHHMTWDGVGLELPDLGLAPVSDQATVLWMEAVAGQVQPDQILVITNDIGQVLFVTAR
jgi:hypothetical protein